MKGLHRCAKQLQHNGPLSFASISELETEDLQVFFAHPYAAWERGSNERHNGLLRRIIPKGTAIRNVSKQRLEELQNGVTR